MYRTARNVVCFALGLAVALAAGLALAQPAVTAEIVATLERTDGMPMLRADVRGFRVECTGPTGAPSVDVEKALSDDDSYNLTDAGFTPGEWACTARTIDQNMQQSDPSVPSVFIVPQAAPLPPTITIRITA